MIPSDLEKLKILFQNFNFHSFKENSFDTHVFFLVLNKMENIYNFPDILWYLFDSNLYYKFTKQQRQEVYNKYFKLFSKNIISNSRENLFKLTNQSFNWFINNIKNAEIFLTKLEEIMNKDDQEMILNEPYILKLYANFLSLYYKKKNNSINEYLINYLQARIIKMDKETLEKVLNIPDNTEKILIYFNQYKLARNDFFQEKSENLELYKLMKDIPNNNYIINSIYFRNSQEIIQKVGIDLQSLNCTYQELLQISSFPDEELNNRIEILQIDTESKNSLKNKIIEKIKEYENY